MKPSEMFANSSQWTKGTFARNQQGKSVAACSKTAACWCLLGRLDMVKPAKERQRFKQAIVQAIRVLTGSKWAFEQETISIYNDAPYRTWADIEQMLKKADEFYEA